MAKKRKKTSKTSRKTKKIEPARKTLRVETKHTIWAVVFFVLAIFLFMSALGVAGVAGEFIHKKIVYYLLGIGNILLPILFLLLSSSFVKSERPNIGLTRAISSFAFLLSGLGMIEIASGNNGAGGLLGRLLATPFVALFDIYASIFFLGAIVVIALLVMFDTRPNLQKFFDKIFGNKSSQKQTYKETNYADEEDEEDEDVIEEVEDEETIEMKKKVEKEIAPLRQKEAKINKGEEESDISFNEDRSDTFSTYSPPPLSLLEKSKGKPNTGDVKANAILIRRTLLNFGIEVEMDEITIGPTVTRYAMKPAEGVKLSKILGLQNELALALAAHPLRIEAPIPGKSLVGVEVPNKSKSIVGLGSLLSSEKFNSSPKPLLIALGRGISGKAVLGNLAKMPHCLVAGATGSGKSVTIHSMISSLLYRNGPSDLKFIMVDPKRVELTLYNSIPHLLTPVITDAKKTILALKWAAKEMDRRYDLLEENSVRDIDSYHKNIYAKRKKEEGENKPERMPYIVIIIDELADIMGTYPRELEAAIVRLAQMSRAVGIHLILSTQRPEVNVITGLIKANVPSRIALKVASQIDSRTILDAKGAEKLLGSGDMLYSSSEGQPQRLQSAYISEDEVKKIVKYLRKAYEDEINEEISLSNETMSIDKGVFESTLEDDRKDEMYEEARATVVAAGKASTSYLQRKLRLGYARAARIMDSLEQNGVIGPADGSKPREVLERKEGTNQEREASYKEEYENTETKEEEF